MTPFIETNKDTIKTSDITIHHLIVGVKDGVPRMLTKRYEDDESSLVFLNLSDDFTAGNGVSNFGTTLKENVEWLMKKGYTVAVFDPTDWDKALQWLIDNGKTK